MEVALEHKLADHFPALKECLGFPDLLGQLQELQPVKVATGTRLFDLGSTTLGFPLVLQGSIRVFKADDQGHTLNLYHVTPGQSCVITSACLLGAKAYPASGEAEADLELLMLPKPLFFTLMDRSKSFRESVFRVFTDRIIELTEIVEAVAFQKLDARLATWLSKRGPEIHTTHQQIAEALGTSREIISRLLKHFEALGAISLQRARILVLKADQLEMIVK